MYIKGCYPQALSYFQDAHERYTAADDREGIANSLNSIANIHFRLGDLDNALLIYDEAIEIYRDLVDTQGLVRALSNKAATLLAANQPSEAEVLLDQADDLSENDTLWPALRLKNRALLLIHCGMQENARELLVQALGLATADDPGVLADIHYSLGHLSMVHEPEQAQYHFEQALALDRASGAFVDIAKDLEALGICQAQMGQLLAAVGSFKRSVKIYALLSNSRQVRAVLARLEKSAATAGVDIRATLHWIHQWLAGHTEATRC